MTAHLLPLPPMPSQATVDAEIAVIGSMILDPATITEVRDIIRVGDFAKLAPAAAYSSVLALADQGINPDLISTNAEIERRGKTTECPPDVLASFLDGVHSAANAVHHARRVVEAARLRRLRASAARVIDVIDAGRAVNGELEEVERLAAEAREGEAFAGAVVTRFSDIAPQPVHWLWPGRIPAGTLVTCDGDPGLGKTTIMFDLASRISSGAPMPDGIGGGIIAGAVIVSAEDDLARTIRPRLDAAGADVSRIATVHVRDHDGVTRDPMLTPGDLVAVEKAIEEVEAKLVILDPLMALLPPEANANRDQDVRRALARLRDLGERTGAAIVVIRHLRKSEASSPLYRGGGSIGIIGAARCGLLIAADPDDETGARRVLAVMKSNLGAIPASLAYTLAVPSGHAVPRIVWGTSVAHDARALLAVPADPEARGAIEEAKDFLRDILADGPKPVRDVLRASRVGGVAERTLDRAKHALGVRSVKHGRPGEAGGWLWALPYAEERQDGRRPPDGEHDTLRGGLAPFRQEALTDDPVEREAIRGEGSIFGDLSPGYGSRDPG